MFRMRKHVVPSTAYPSRDRTRQVLTAGMHDPRLEHGASGMVSGDACLIQMQAWEETAAIL